MAVSAFGVEDSRLDEIGKADHQHSAGRTFWSAYAPGFHGAIAGRKGKKVRATANEAVSSGVGELAGQVAGAGLGAALTRGRPAGIMIGQGVGGVGGLVAGGIHGMHRNQRKGYYRPIDRS